MSPCLEENEIVDFVMRNLDPEDAAKAEAHIDSCVACRAVLIELARVFELRASLLPIEDEISHEDDSDVSEPASLGLLPPELLKGAKVGRYMMIDLLGTGAMGVVFSAYDPELDRKVAVKVLRDRSGNEERNARMVREARATARLAHPNVVVVHDVGEFEGNVFMAMELVTGGTLGDWLGSEKRSRNEVLDAFIEAGEGLAAAHDAGLVHRDFKPANVLMGDNRRPRVTDFGLARAGDAAETTQETLSSLSGSLDVAVTKTGALVGTPAYMSPEQFEGRIADARSDQFSFCVALAEALCGERPFAGKSLMELQTTVCAGKLRAGALEGLPRPLQVALQCGLRREPGERHADMHALLRALRRVRRSSPAKTWTRVGLIAVAVLGGAGAAWAGNEAKVEAPTFETCKADAPAVADVWTSAARRDLEATIASIDRPAAARIARSVVSSLDAYAAGWGAVHADACASDEDLGVRFAQLRCLDRGRVELEALLKALGQGNVAVLEHAEDAVRGLPQPNACATPGWRDTAAAEPPEAIREDVERLQLDFEVANAYLATGQYALAVENAGVVAEASRKVGYVPLVIDALLVQAEAASTLGHQDDARASLQTAWADAIRGNDPRSQVRVASTMIDVVGNEQHERDDGEFWVDVARAALEGVDAEDPVAWEFWNALAKFRAYQGKYDEALDATERALAIPGLSESQMLSTKKARLAIASLHAGSADQETLLAESRALAESLRETLGPEHPRNVSTAQNLASILTALGRGDEAVAELNEAMRIATDVFPDNDVRIAGLLASRASARSTQGDLKGARDDSARVVEIRKALGADETALGLAYNNLAVAEISLHEFEAAVENLEHALPLMEVGFGREHVNIASVHTSISSSLIALERYEEARGHLEEAKRIAANLGPMSARLDPIIALNLARVELHAGNLEAATTLSREGLASAKAAYGDSHPTLAKFIGVEGKIALAKKRPADALEAADRGMRLANDPVTKAALEMLRAHAHAEQGDAAGCVGARDAAKALDATLVDDPC